MTLSSLTPSRVSARISNIAESATLAIDAKAKALKASGAPIISFGAGEPDFPTPSHIVEAAKAACEKPENHKYTPAGGLPQLREAIATKTLRDSDVAVEASQVLVTNGGKQAVYEAFAVLLNNGDEVLLPTPYWTTYPEAIALAGGKTVPVFSGSDAGYIVNIEQLEAARTPRTKALLLCSPSNPTGAVYSGEQLRAIAQWAHENDLWIVTDEIYEHLVYDGTNVAPSIMAAFPDINDKCIVLNGVAKTYSMTGWRVGWMVGPRDIVAAATTMQSHVTSNVCNVAQEAALAAVSDDLSASHAMREAFDRRRRAITEALQSIEGMLCPEPQGAFYVFPDVRAFLGQSIAGQLVSSSAQLAEVILEESQVALVPGEAFGAPGYLRISYALSDADLDEGAERLRKLLASAA